MKLPGVNKGSMSGEKLDMIGQYLMHPISLEGRILLDMRSLGDLIRIVWDNG